MRKSRLLLVFVVLIVSSLAFPVLAFERSGHINILAVTEDGDMKVGSKADLFLEIKDGTGRVFIETFPFSKFDTQISTRFAKDVACKFLDRDCRKYDFFYRIQADAALIGGPSAGGAVGVLTAALLSGETPDDKVAITGTITSGGIIGPVGGVQEKIEAAQEAGMMKVVIPVVSATEGFGNVTLDFEKYGDEIGIEVVKVTGLGEALKEFTGRDYPREDGEILVDESYKSVMNELAFDLCNRTSLLRQDFLSQKKGTEVNLSDLGVDTVEGDSENSTKRSKEALKTGDYYSAASYCFGANVNYRYLSFYVQNISVKDTKELINKTRNEIESVRESLGDLNIQTITDLQTLMIVSERLREAEDSLKETKEGINETHLRAYRMAYSIERLYSAYSWSMFFDRPGEVYDIDEKELEDSCTLKLAEAEELLQYVSLYIPSAIEDRAEFLEKAREDKNKGDYVSCLFKASKAKAESSVILGSMGITNDQVEDFITQKLGVARSVIFGETQKGRFPIIGYSYYEYANSLKEDNPYSALVYSEYALELSNLDLYFQKEVWRSPVDVRWELILVFVLGVVLGALVMNLIRNKG